tara:strand:- start:3557 stop:3709 length:153 start_codon:yes stop_codon:yes gene_type:complete
MIKYLSLIKLLFSRVAKCELLKLGLNISKMQKIKVVFDPKKYIKLKNSWQ